VTPAAITVPVPIQENRPRRPPGRAPRLTREDAETLAIRVVAFLAEREDLFLRFVALSGMSVDQVRASLADPAVLGAVLDFVLADEALVLELAAALAVPADLPARARRLLPGAPVED
jgi:hypothetical protein